MFRPDFRLPGPFAGVPSRVQSGKGAVPGGWVGGVLPSWPDSGSARSFVETGPGAGWRRTTHRELSSGQDDVNSRRYSRVSSEGGGRERLRRENREMRDSPFLCL
jgi:hypothetical protein